eukprot:m.276330 g.276330  ORF g.276330 m.276330 type:complete len:94 (+) comp16143_c0_seq1:2520-2801(+)
MKQQQTRHQGSLFISSAAPQPRATAAIPNSGDTPPPCGLQLKGPTSSQLEWRDQGLSRIAAVVLPDWESHPRVGLRAHEPTLNATAGASRSRG